MAPGAAPGFGDIANAETWLAVIAALVAVLVLMLAAAFVFYLLGAYFRAIDVRDRIRGTGAEARREMDELSRQHLGAVAAAVARDIGGNDP